MARKIDVLYVNGYTEGSAARKIAPAFPEAKPQRKPRARNKRRVIAIDPVAIGSIIVAVFLLVMMVFGMTTYQNAVEDAQMMENYLHSLQNENEALSAQLWEDVDLAEVERTALALGMVPKDSIPVHRIQLQEPVPQESESDWLDQLVAILTNLFA
ncbi:MAG: hypothetical protein J6C41_00840 [Oscillospiraceae bacterium]|nr:hypothetical protein [Oscillospiraceae bacterium]